MSAARPLVLVIGGAGVFGANVCRRLARLRLCRILIGGRHADNALPLTGELSALDAQCEPRFIAIDRSKPDAGQIKQLGLFAVVDAAGPFQGSSYALVEAVIAAGVHYIDLCDARDFAKGINAFDQAAKAAGVAVLTGASSTPALSNALLRDMLSSCQSVDRISVSILPGNHAPRGRSVIAAILSWVGEPVRVFDDGKWQMQAGWSGSRKISLGALGWRNAALAETPDLDVLVDDFRPRISARFHAGLELGIMHHGLRFAGWMRRWRLLPRLDRLTGLFLILAEPLGTFGTDVGGMIVEVDAVDAQGLAVHVTARLIARNGDGPIIPALASVAILKRLLDGRLDFRGADHAGHHIETGEIMALVPDLAIALEQTVEARPVPLFRKVLGDPDFQIMPQVTQKLHRGLPAVIASGFADVEPADNFLGRVVSALFGFPKPGQNVPVNVLIKQSDAGERWQRRYRDRTMSSVMSNGDAENQELEERFGVFSFRMKISAHIDGLEMEMVSARAGKMPLPAFLTPKITATERVDDRGRHLFDVAINLPLIGRVVRYKGWLALS